MVRFNILTANKLFSDRNFLELQDRRIEQLKILSNLYQESPIKITERIEIIDNIYRKKTGDNDKKTTRTLDNSAHLQDGEKDQDNLSDISSANKKIFQKNNSMEKNINDTLNSIGSLNGENSKLITSNTNTDRKDKKNGKADESEKSENENLPVANLSAINNIPERVFNKITSGYKLILFISLSVYMIYCIIFFIIVLLGCNRLSYLVNYCEVNNRIDGYLFDNFNTLLYMYISDSNSTFYGRIIDDNKKDYDYLKEGINEFYASIQEKETIELNHKDIFPAIYELVDLDCSKEMIPDNYFQKALESSNINYADYFKEICQMFPVATTGNDNTMLFEVLYMIDQLYNKFVQANFTEMFQQLNNTVLFDCYTLVLTLNRIIRNHFNNDIFIKEVNDVFNYFSTLIIIYLVFNMVFEIILFLLLNMGIIYQIKHNNKLMLDFIDSLKF